MMIRRKVGDFLRRRKSLCVPIIHMLLYWNLIRGWDKGIAGLPAGSSVRLIIPSALGYGERGAGEDIPPFSPLMFDIDIISVN